MPGRSMAVITLLTDFGTRDYYVAAMRGVLLTQAPSAVLVDVTHDIDPGDVAGGAFVLAAAAPRFPPDTVHCAVVDPGVGGERRLLAARASTAWLVGPDNGLLAPLLDGDAEIRSVNRPDLYLGGPGQTFHGRDRFAPIAAYLAAGGSLGELGPAIDDPVRLDLPPPRRRDGLLEGRVAHIDRFGNLVTDLPSTWLPDGAQPRARVGAHAVRRYVARYEQLAEGEAGLLPGSLGTLELSLRDGNLADLWQVRRDAAVSVLFG